MKHFVYIILFLSSFSGIAQNQGQIDSVNNEFINKNLHDTSYLNLLHGLGEQSPIFRISYWDTIFRIAQKSQENYPRNIKVQKSLHKHQGDALNNMGFLYNRQGDIASAIRYYHESLKIREAIGDQKGMASSLNNLGANYREQGEPEAALKNFKRALKIRKEIDDKQGISTSLHSIAFVYKGLKNYEKAKEFYFKSLKIREEIGYESGIATSYNNLGVIAKLQNDYDLAITYFEKAYKIHVKLNDSYQACASLNNIGSTNLLMGKIKEAQNAAVSAMEIATSKGIPNEINFAARTLSAVFEKQGKGMKALEMYQLHVQMKDSIINEATQKATIRQQTQYEFEKAQIVKENEAKEEARVLAAETGRRNNIQYSLILLGILVLFGVILSLGFIKVSPNVAEGVIFFAFLILFEFLLVFTEPYLEQYTNGEPMYNLLANSVLALVIFPIHAVLEKLLKKRIVK